MTDHQRGMEMSNAMIEAACSATILGEDEQGRPVYLSPEEARTAITAAISAYLATTEPSKPEVKEISKELEAQIREILEWQKTGVLSGPHLRSRATKINDESAGAYHVDGGLSAAEEQVKRECMHLVLSAALRAELSKPVEEAVKVNVNVENERLRHIVSDCAAALVSGAFISPKASVEFMEGLPKEISLVVSGLRNRCAELEAALKASYTAGFKASAQGWNGEHGCETETDPDFLKGRDDYVHSLRSYHEEKSI
jgi:hypothetical protein